MPGRLAHSVYHDDAFANMGTIAATAQFGIVAHAASEVVWVFIADRASRPGLAVLGGQPSFVHFAIWDVLGLVLTALTTIAEGSNVMAYLVQLQAAVMQTDAGAMPDCVASSSCRIAASPRPRLASWRRAFVYTFER